jgi:hypothetical protein
MWEITLSSRDSSEEKILEMSLTLSASLGWLIAALFLSPQKVGSFIE